MEEVTSQYAANAPQILERPYAQDIIGKEILKDLFLYISDISKYIDSDIYEHIRMLKNDILVAPLKRGWFKSIKYCNKHKLADNAEIITKIIEIKTSELETYIKNIL